MSDLDEFHQRCANCGHKYSKHSSNGNTLECDKASCFCTDYTTKRHDTFDLIILTVLSISAVLGLIAFFTLYPING